MIRLDKQFLFGKFKGIFEVYCKEENPLHFVLKKMLEKELIDGIIGTTHDEKSLKAKLFTNSNNLELSSISFNGGQISLLKKAIQKYRLKKIAVVAPSCILDGLNKTQYYGIGCNWVKTAIALKIGILCLGVATEESLKYEVLDIAQKKSKVRRSYVAEEGFILETVEGTKIKVDMETHHHYVNSACKYCLNLSARGSDITYVPLEDKKRAIFIIRSERGWRTLSIVQKAFSQKLQFKFLNYSDIKYLEDLLKKKVILNIDSILERVDIGLPAPKWNNNRFRKFYRIWNSINEINIEEEVF
ncbi:Coenzyme F420 hydrogenase/dehydrogenase, beta subunit C-terminal domain [Desulfurobacterium thermolithotrophum]|uniref:Coenzyme F420 hydrogenase/dehydrogenase, beta subunit C-terminal domain n=1 Tax=Desulfurobacterium thermolithotrophum TaxID=64160 RepID=UPI0013CFEFF6|nr:Coenzyme F420 hydrogenase/dehydrogenase, beta subunit C-terminal domain [Desulfurobacterium thermolithotrophum]